MDARTIGWVVLGGLIVLAGVVLVPAAWPTLIVWAVIAVVGLTWRARTGHR